MYVHVQSNCVKARCPSDKTINFFCKKTKSFPRFFFSFEKMVNYGFVAIAVVGIVLVAFCQQGMKINRFCFVFIEIDFY